MSKKYLVWLKFFNDRNPEAGLVEVTEDEAKMFEYDEVICTKKTLSYSIVFNTLLEAQELFDEVLA